MQHFTLVKNRRLTPLLTLDYETFHQFCTTSRKRKTTVLKLKCFYSVLKLERFSFIKHTICWATGKSLDVLWISLCDLLKRMRETRQTEESSCNALVRRWVSSIKLHICSVVFSRPRCYEIVIIQTTEGLHSVASGVSGRITLRRELF